MKKQVFFGTLVTIVALLNFTSCKEEIKPDFGFGDGTLVVCEGSFGTNTGEISYIKDSTVTDLFKEINDRPLGDIVQSLTVVGKYAYIVVNNSQKIEVVDIETFESVATIKDLSYPRQVSSINDETILITNGNGYSDNYLFVLDANTFEITDTIATGAGPEKIIVTDNKIWVSNSGQWSNDNTITVIDAQTLEVIKTIEVGDVPADMVLDTDGNIWTFCKGYSTYDYVTYEATVISNSSIVKVNTKTYETETIVSFDHQIAPFGTNVMTALNDIIYFIDDAVYGITTTNTTPQKLFEGIFYGIDIDPSTGYLWVGNATGLTQHTVDVYSAKGIKQASYKTAQFPNSTIFQ